MQLGMLPDASQYLVYEPRFLDPDAPEGLWLCTDAEDAAAVEINAACLAAGVPWEALRLCRTFFEAFSCVLVVGADSARRAALADALRRQVPSVEVCVTAQSAYLGCGSVRELRETHGLERVERLWEDAEELPPYGLVEMSSVEAVDISHQPHARSGIPGLDQLIGGLYEGELSLWTGKRKEGKSTLLGLPILSALREGRRVCVYSGELPTWRYKAWLLAMAAGPDYLLEEATDTGKSVWVPRPEIARQVDLWWKRRLFQFDHRAADIHKPEVLLGIMRYAWKRYGCSVFVVDNLMTVDLTGEDYYRAQSRFVGQLVDFSHETKAHVHLVAHRRKGGTSKGSKGDSDDVSGSGDLTNRADNVFAVSRAEDDETLYDARLEILANRDFGATGTLLLHFDVRSRRYYASTPNWRCGWEPEHLAQETLKPFQELTGPDADNPF